MIRGVLGLVLSSSLLAAEPGLIGGRVVNKADWPEVIRIRHGNSSCSAAVVGPRVIMTAAHCSAAGGVITPTSEDAEYTFEAAAATYKAKCTLSPAYDSADHDMALCLTDRDVNVRFASLANYQPKLAKLVTLTGYGCVRAGGGGGNNGQLKVGDAKVTQIAHDQPFDYWFFTEGSVATCFGDSGSPVFKQVTDPRQPKLVLGITSRGDIRRKSLLIAVGLEISRKFAQDFEQANNVQICGVSKVCDGGK